MGGGDGGGVRVLPLRKKNFLKLYLSYLRPEVRFATKLEWANIKKIFLRLLFFLLEMCLGFGNRDRTLQILYNTFIIQGALNQQIVYEKSLQFV